MTALLAALACVVIVSVLGAVFYGVYKSSQVTETSQTHHKVQEEAEEEQPVARGRTNARDRMQARLRQRRAANETANAAAPPAGTDSASDTDGDPDEQDERMPRSKKDKKKDDKQQQQEARLAQQDAREKKATAYDEQRRAKQEQKEQVRKAQEEEIKRAEEERLKKEEEEAAKWLGMISVEKEGTGEGDDQEESQGLLGQFIDYIKLRKTVPLEQLATEFKLRTTDVIDRVNGLEAMGRLTGVMDERGKYIYISMEEMQAVANYITTKGRVAISELAAKSNQFIDLEAKAATIDAVGGQPAVDFDELVGNADAADAPDA